MKALLWIFTLLFWGAVLATAQTQDTLKTDVVVLTDGSILKGKRIAAIQPGHVRLRLTNGTEVEFAIETIAEIRKDLPPKIRKPHQVQAKGLYATVTAGLLFGNIDQDPVSFTSGAAIGYRFLPQLYVAGGGGTDIHGSSGDMFAPVYARIGGEAMKTRVSPSYYFQGGYAFPLDAPGEYFDVEGGAYYEGGVGATFRTASRIYWTLNLSYRQYKTQRSLYNDWWWGNDGSYITEKRTFRRFGLTAGMCF